MSEAAAAWLAVGIMLGWLLGHFLEWFYWHFYRIKPSYLRGEDEHGH